MADVTHLLAAAEAGDPRAAADLLPLIYDELRKLAAARLAGEQPGQTLQPTALAHEAYIRLVGGADDRPWNSRGHFFAAAAEAIRRILVENARRKKALKRGGQRNRVELDDVGAVAGSPPEELLAVHEALEQLEWQDATAGQLVKLRYFAGLSVDQAAEAIGISAATAYRHWAFARAWLHARVLADGREPGT